MSSALPVLLIVDATHQRANTEFTAILEKLSLQVVATAPAAGWDPRRISIGDASEDEVAGAYRGADGVVIMGGEDTDPSFYGGAADYPRRDVFLPTADERSIAMIRSTIVDNIPLLGICRGQQLINIALGGTLIQHLDDVEDHKRPDADGCVRHGVDIAPGSELSRLFGTRLETVESSHHQAVDRIAPGLAVSAVADDGVVEALEHQFAPLFGVQWHPEAAHAVPEHLVAMLALLCDRVPAPVTAPA